MIACPKCGSTLRFENHSLIGGDKDYWLCPFCGQEKVMFGVLKK